jgi:putative addiction module component (TIGR02574 family)
MSSEELKTAALSLPREQRAQLAEDLIRSLDENHEEADVAWANDVARRAQEIADGTVQAVDWEVARERIARRLLERRREASASSRG